MAKSTLDVLKGARDLIANGWVQGHETDVVDGTRCYCIDGALLRAAGGKVDGKYVIFGGSLQEDLISESGYYTAVAAVKDYIKREDPIWRGVAVHVRYNDANERTQDEVVGLLDRVIAEAEAVRA